MSLKKKLQNALKTLKTGLADQDLDSEFAKIFAAVENLPDEPKATEPVELPPPVINPDEIALFSDGACRGNPGPGSWAFLAQDHLGVVLQKSSGVSESTTNNKMELQGAIEGLNFLLDQPNEYKKVYFYTDSRYVVDGITTWVKGWKSRGWKKADKKPPENLELWKTLDHLNDQFNVEFVWVKGHAGHPQNELCDQMANEALDAQGF